MPFITFGQERTLIILQFPSDDQIVESTALVEVDNVPVKCHLPAHRDRLKIVSMGPGVNAGNRGQVLTWDIFLKNVPCQDLTPIVFLSDGCGRPPALSLQTKESGRIAANMISRAYNVQFISKNLMT